MEYEYDLQVFSQVEVRAVVTATARLPILGDASGLGWMNVSLAYKGGLSIGFD
jgi:hypothetical protein